MKIIVCLDDNNGMLFNGRRQSMDAVVRQRICQIAVGQILRMNAYSAGQFTDACNCIAVDDNFLDIASENDFCFVEDLDIAPYATKVNTVIIYRWNRNYPQDVCFPVSLFSDKWNLVSNCDFKGNSHERITEEVYYL